jgi:phosphatidylserine/phosphatidylglycerophosphate/cardiolipin synthase-like enzyme
LDQITEVIASAERTLDITLLFNVDPSVSGFPDGGFRDAIAKGFKALSDKSRPPEIWILFGAPLDPNAYRKVSSRMPLLLPVAGAGAGLQKWLDTTYPKKMKAWLQATIKLYQDDLKAMKCPVHVALNNPSTWNHAKIIAADDRRVITGGHNFWAGDYLGGAPVHDVSGRFDGPAARGAHRFCDKLWQGATHTIHLINGNWTQSDPARVVIDDDPVPPAGKVDMLSLGRLGRGLGDFSISSNASVTARIVALCKAKRIIRISQQSLLGFGSTPYDFYTCLAIVRAVRAGVDVQIVLSNELNNYGGSAPGVLRQLQNMYLADIQQTPPDDRYKLAPSRDNIDAWADLASGQKPLVSVMKGRSSWDPRLKDFNDKLTLATLYYSDDKRWKVGGRWFDAGNHCKVYIIDEDCFYVGSDNFYPSLHKEGLQEFGFLVEDKNETQNFTATYWDNLWKYSEKGRLS